MLYFGKLYLLYPIKDSIVRAKFVKPFPNSVIQSVEVEEIFWLVCLTTYKMEVVISSNFLLLFGTMNVGADYRARMVYDYNAGGRSCSRPIEFTKRIISNSIFSKWGSEKRSYLIVKHPLRSLYFFSPIPFTFFNSSTERNPFLFSR